MNSPYSGAGQTHGSFDWSQWYLEDPDVAVAESWEQGSVIAELMSSLDELARQRGWTRQHVHSHMFFAWIRAEPLVRVCPDVYLMDGPIPSPSPKSWQLWRKGHKPPRWAIEVVSEDWKKDYRNNPAKYSQLGCLELVLFDPEMTRSEQSRGGERAAFTVFRRGASGQLERVYSGAGPAWSRELGAWHVASREGYDTRVRIALDERGTQIVPWARKRADIAEELLADQKKKTRSAEQKLEDERKKARAAEQKLADERKKTRSAKQQSAPAKAREPQRLDQPRPGVKRPPRKPR